MQIIKSERGKRIVALIVENVKILLISLAIILPVRYFLIQPFYVKGASMEPNFYNREYLIVNEIGYRFDDPKRGDVIVFKYPLDKKQYFIKRVIGLPNERVVIDNNSIIIYNQNLKDEGIKLDESYLDINNKTTGKTDIILEDDEYFVLGDNREHSLDSRIFGILPEDLIVGKAWFRGWPFERFGFLDNFEY